MRRRDCAAAQQQTGKVDSEPAAAIAGIFPGVVSDPMPRLLCYSSGIDSVGLLSAYWHSPAKSRTGEKKNCRLTAGNLFYSGKIVSGPHLLTPPP